MVDHCLPLRETTAGRALNRELKQSMTALQVAARRLRGRARKQGDPLALHELNKRQAEIDERIVQTANQLKELKVPFTAQIRAFFRGRGSE